MMTKEKLPHLLDKFYAGASTPDEELLLYLTLLDEPADSIYQADLRVVETLFAEAHQLHSKAIALPPLKKAGNRAYMFKKYAVAAALPLLLTLGAMGIYRSISEERSFRNDTYIAQEEVDRHAQRAFSLLNDCLESGYSSCAKAQSALNDASYFIETSYQQLDPVMERTPYGWETLPLHYPTN